jgi:bacillithiol synthase
VNSHCFPFRHIPHSTRLFLDYLETTSSVTQFFPRPPRFHQWAQEESSRVRYPAERRQQLADVLEVQNRAFGASDKALESIAAFRSGALALVTGQQVGLFGGPAFSIYKALSAIRLSQNARQLGVNCVPVFWLATEDHDLKEVSQVRLPAPNSDWESFATTAHGGEDAPVGTITFGPEISELAERLSSALGESEISKEIRECYRARETFGSAFAKWFAGIFADFGVVLLDGADPALDTIAAPLYREVVERSAELNAALLERDKDLQAAGYHQQVRITSSSTPLFMIRNGSRIPVHADSGGAFLIGQDAISRDAMRKLAASSPQSFSPNVLLRPVLQDYLLPTLAYVGGSAEIAYFAQAGALYEALLGRITPIVPRFSATLIEAKAQALLERYKLVFSDLFHGPQGLQERIGSTLLGANLQSSFQQAKTVISGSMQEVGEALAHLDKTLLESAQNAESKMLYQLTNLQSRAARAELRQTEVADRHAQFLSTALYPDKTLQEREFAGVHFLAKYGRGLLKNLLELIDPDCVDHQLVTL